MYAPVRLSRTVNLSIDSLKSSTIDVRLDDSSDDKINSYMSTPSFELWLAAIFSKLRPLENVNSTCLGTTSG